jgi:DNA-directed RNA polymerase subunit RPC12/RpoP
MRSSAKTVGILMTVGGLALLLLVVAWVLQGVRNDDVEGTGATLGIGIAAIILLPIILGGVYMLIKGRSETAELAQIDKQRQLLNIVQTRGQVSISDLVLELKSTRDEVQANLEELVGRGLFSGYVDWKRGMLFSVEASSLQGQSQCPNCGGAIELGGKGLLTCPYCGAQIFLSGSE